VFCWTEQLLQNARYACSFASKEANENSGDLAFGQMHVARAIRVEKLLSVTD
jgi:hypothetical protein